MAYERKTTVTYSGTGSQTTFAFAFDYLQKSFVKVKVDGNVLEYGIGYTVTDKQVDFTTAPINGAIIVIYRETQSTSLVTWADASILRAADLSVQEIQMLHLAEETSDLSVVTDLDLQVQIDAQQVQLDAQVSTRDETVAAKNVTVAARDETLVARDETLVARDDAFLMSIVFNNN